MGRVFLFDAATGEHLRTIPSPPPESELGSSFGDALAALGGGLLVAGFSTQEKVYVFDVGSGEAVASYGWPHQPQGMPRGSGKFGERVAVVGGDVLALAPHDGLAGNTPADAVSGGGAAYRLRGPER